MAGVRVRILTRMARHRAPDVVPALHGPSPTAGHPTGFDRPRHAAGPAQAGPGGSRSGRHRGGAGTAERVFAPVREAPAALEFLPPLVVVEPDSEPVKLAPVLPAEPAPVAVAAPPPDAEPSARADAQPYAEVVAWAGFASLVAAGVVSAGQGPREQAIWTLGVLGAVLSTTGLGWLAALRRRGPRDLEYPQ